MARYWVFLNDEVAGPYEVEQLIRLRGFSRQTQVCVDDASGAPRHWISPAEIPELAHIFKVVDQHELPTPPSQPPPKPVARPAPSRPAPRPAAPAARMEAPSKSNFPYWIWGLLFCLLLGGAAFSFWHWQQKQALETEKQSARTMLEQFRLPPSSLYGSLRQYFDEKGIKPRWEFERTTEGLQNVTLSWYAAAGALSVYAFEVNLQAQSVRGLNTAAARLLAEGFPSPSRAKSKPEAAPSKSPAEKFPDALDHRAQAVSSGDFSAVWDLFSRRRKSEMARAGMSQDGFIRLQSLTHKVESPVTETVVKTKKQSDQEMLVLLKQAQEKRPDIYVKQLWIYENGDWKLDDEDKHTAAAPTPTPAADAPAPPPAASASDAPADKPNPAAVLSLPGVAPH